MIQSLTNAYKKVKIHAKQNPKRVFIISFCLLTSMLIYNLFFNKSKYQNPFKVTELSVDTKLGQKINELNESKQNLQKIETIIKELDKYKTLHDEGLLTKKDSLRIKYLYEEFNKYK